MHPGNIDFKPLNHSRHWEKIARNCNEEVFGTRGSFFCSK